MLGIPEDATFEEPELACMLESLQKGKKGSGKGFRRGKKGWRKGGSRDVLKLSTKEAGMGGRPENYKHVRLKLQSDRLNRGWRDQPAHGTNKHLAKDCPQNKETTTNSEAFFSGMDCNDSCTVHPRNDVCADHSRDNSRADDFRDESRADDDSRNEPSADVDSRNLLCVEGDFSSSSFSLGSVVVVGSRESQCRDVKLESGGGVEHNMCTKP